MSNPSRITITAAEVLAVRDGAAANRDEALRQAILGVLDGPEEEGLTRKAIWEQLPDEVRRNEPKFREVMEQWIGVLWRKEERAARGGGSVYRLGITEG